MRPFSWCFAALVSVYSITALVYTTNWLLSKFLSPHIPILPLASTLLPSPLHAQHHSLSYLGNSTEPAFISKAFSSSMKPSRIVPYYYRATRTPEEEDITITTLVTGNRFHVFSRLVSSYQGPISATVHISSTPIDLRDSLLKTLHTLYLSNPYMAQYVDIHLVLDPFERQFNLWRNVARFYARTDYVMMLDVDFAICTDFRRRILTSEGTDRVRSKLRDGRMALVVPAFEFIRQKDGVNASTFPKDKKALLELVKEEKIDMFHKSWKPGHGSTDFERYYAAPPGEIYRVSTYQHSYEPYVIFKREGTPWCDERFVGYGGNKAACLFELYVSGVSFYVLADDFLIHQSHTYAEQVRKQERKYNAKVYATFREETCLRYLARFFLDGSLNKEIGHNAQEQCAKVPGVPHLASQMFKSLPADAKE